MSDKAPQLVRIDAVSEERGKLRYLEFGRDLGFVARRFFIISEVPAGVLRGGHAHRQCHQLLCCLQGHVDVTVETGQQSETYQLTSPELALYLPPVTWGLLKNFAPETLLLVLASEPFDAAEYIYEHSEFLAMTRGNS